MRYLVTGGAGFIGSNYVDRLLDRGEQVEVLDNLSRPGSAANLAWLRARHGERSFRFLPADVRERTPLEEAARAADVIIHLAAQVAVTTALARPREDFDVNALGTLNVLEAARRSPARPIVVYASTNKVYGSLEELDVVEEPTRYGCPTHPHGVGEEHPLAFDSPYGCSKGCGDQYTLAFARSYGLRAVVLRQSCVYGPRQFGLEDQGWLAHFAIAAVSGRQITVYGDGKQVRDVLDVADLCACYDRVLERVDVAAGRVYNIGGGPARTLSVWHELGPLLERLAGRTLAVGRAPRRPGDQRYYVSDLRRATAELGWAPTIGVGEGIAALVRWVEANRELFRDFP